MHMYSLSLDAQRCGRIRAPSFFDKKLTRDFRCTCMDALTDYGVQASARMKFATKEEFTPTEKYKFGTSEIEHNDGADESGAFINLRHWPSLDIKLAFR